jgi:RecB family exonuclease
MTTMALSFSRLSTFEQCERKFEYLYVSKLVKDEDNQYTIYGNRVHEALEAYGKAREANDPETRATLSDGETFKEIKAWVPLVDRVLGVPGDKLFEFKMAIRRDFTTCDWFAPDVWLRSIADVLVINKTTAYVLDWKTGKVKNNPTQLKLFACMVFAHFPAVDTVKTAFVWLAHDDVTMDEYKRDNLQALWMTLTPRLTAVQEAVDVGVFRATPSGLCRFCPARGICPDRKR